MRMRNLYKKRLLLLILLFAVGWTEAQTNSRGNIGALNGVFSVSQNTQVCFSKGNLQYKASTNTWRFALNQWDFVGGTNGDTGIEHGNVYDNGVKSKNNLISSTYDGWIDLFGWGTSGYNHGAVNYQPWATESDWDSFMNSTNYYAYGNSNNDLNSYSGKADWGYNAISNGGDQENQWRTLTKDEWVYLINTRSTPSGIRFVHATVNGVIGLILLPDNWDSSIYTLNDINNGEANASAESNVLNVAQWNVLEDNGAVFLPKNGYLWMDTYSENEFNYWSSTHYNGDAYTFTYNEFVFQSDASWFRAVGMGVRLVKNASTETSYLIRAIPNSSSLGTVEGSGTYNLGETCTLTAIPNEDCIFISWTIDGAVVSEEPEIVFTVNHNLSLVANFQAIVQYTLNVSANPSYAGKITGVFDFEDGKQGWTAIDNDGDGHNWMLSSLMGQIECHSGNGSLVSASSEDEPITPDNWLVSPPLELGGSVSLWARGLDPEYFAEHFAIYVSTNSNSIDDFTQISEEFIVGSEYVQYSVDLSAYSGMGFIAIRHFNCTDMYYLDIDDITIVSSAFSMKHQEGKACSFSATPSEGQEFFNWTEDSELVSTDAEYSFTVTSDRSLVANFSVNNNSYEITATASPEEGGGVIGGGTYNHGAICTLTATPNDGFVFSSWIEDGESVSTNAIYSFMATQERNLVAVFSPLYTITAAANPVEGGSVSFVGMTGDTYDITIHDVTNTNEYVPLYGYYADACLKSEMVYPAADLSVLGGKSITSITFYATQDNVSWGAANFKVFLKEVNSTSISDFSGPGTIVYMGPLNISGNQMTVNFNTPYYYNGGNLLVGVYNTVNGNFVRSNWYGETVDGSSVQGYSYNGLDAISPTQRNFLPKTTITYLGDVGGTVYVAGDTCTVQARPMEGYEFVNWTENGEEVSTDIEYSFTVTGDRNLVANFDVIPLYTITAYPNPEEGGSVEGEGEWYKGETCTLIAYANEGYQFDSWRENGEVVSESPSYTFTVLSDRTLEAYFVESQYYMFSLATTPQEGGTIMTGLYTEIETPFTTEEPVEEQDISIVARANEGWSFAYWTSNDEVLSANNVFTFHLSENTDLVAHFEQCEVNPEPDPDLLNGRFSISGCTTVGFAKGNVIAQIHIDTIYDTPMPTSASWQFADTQYYRQEYDADYISENGIGELLADGMDLVWDVYRYLGVVDIGCWHQLSGAEWDYLLNQRDMEVRYAFAEVNDVVGLLILPDNWNISYVFDSPNTPASYETNIIPLDDWESILEPAGALFLPANGAINGNNISYIEDLDGSGIPVGFYGKMIFHPVMGILNEETTPSIVEVTSAAYFSMRLAQIMDQATSTVTASIEPTQTEYGMVSGGGDFSCGDECTVLAMANDGYVFRYWLDGTDVVSLDAEYTFTIEGDRNLIAVFADENAVCTVEFELVSGMNGLLGWGGEALQLNFGDNSPSITLTIPAPENDWNAIMIALSSGQSVGVNDLNLAQSRIFTFPINKETSVEMTWLAPSNNMGMNMSNSFTARYINGETIIENAKSSDLPSTFQCRCDDVLLVVNPEEGGYINIEGALSIGETVTLTAVANYGYSFVNWTFNGVEVSTEPTYSFMITEAGDMVANFELDSFEITVTYTPLEGGVVTGEGLYEYGTTCTVTAEPGEGYSFMYWTEDGSIVSNNSSYSFQVTRDRDLVAYFSLPLTITVETYPYESGVVNDGGVFDYGSICTLIAEPNNGYTFNCWTENGTIVSTSSTYSFPVTHDCNLIACFTTSSNTSILSGLFSVSENGRVNFSQGNLQYKASTHTWRFATNQYDFIGNGNSNISSNYSDWIDLFGWGTSNFNHGAVCYQPWSTSTTYSDYYAYGSDTYNLFDQTGQADWGCNAINNGGNTANSSLRTLTHEEWLYILYSRNTTSGIRFAKAKVNDVNGMILLPDDWKSSIYRLNNTNNNSSSCDGNVITAEIWSSIFEANGAVFLPAAGERYGTTVRDVGSDGCYWSASYQDSNYAWRLAFVSNANTFPTIAISRNTGQSVRLVSSLLSISASPNLDERGSITGRLGEYMYGSTCSLSATANEGFTFMNWTENGVVVSTASTYSFVVTQERELVANFQAPLSITAIITPEESGSVTGIGLYDFNSECTLTAIPNEGYVFSGWTENGQLVSTEEVYVFTVTTNRSLVANFGRLITVMANPSEGGTVQGAGIYSDGDECILTASANTGYDFINWTSSGVEVSTSSSYSFIVTQNNNYVANFELKNYEITAISNPEIGGVVTGMGNYSHGAQCTLTAIPNENYNFLNWTENGTLVSTNSSYTFSASRDRALVANFIRTFTITASSSPLEGGVISSEYFYDDGNYVSSLGATGGRQIWWGIKLPAGSYLGNTLTKVSAFDAVSMTGTVTIYNDGEDAPANPVGSMDVTFTDCRSFVDFIFESPLFIDTSKNVWIVFCSAEGISYPIPCCRNTGDKNGRWVSLDGTTWNDIVEISSYWYTFMVRATFEATQLEGIMAEGATCTMTALPNEGYGFSEWTENGETVSTDATYSFTVTGDRNLEAIFLPVYVINAEAYPQEGGYVTGAGNFFGGETCSLTATPAEGYRFNYWTENGSVVYRMNNYQFIVTGNRNLEADFSLKTYSITTSANPAEGGTVEGGGTYTHGTECYLWAYPNEGYTFSNWTLNGEVVSTDDWFVFIVTSAGDYVANFIPISYEITANANPVEGGTVTGAGNYDHGTECTLTATAQVGYTFVNWTLDGVEVSAYPTYTFTVYEDATYVANITGAGNYYHGSGCALTATPNEGYTFMYWSEGGNMVSYEANYSFVATGDRALVAHFAANEQNLSLNPGWTWLSSYIEMDGIDGLGMLENGLNPNGVMIKSQRDGFVSYANEMWMGTLENITNEKMYLVNTNEASNVNFTGPVAQLNAHPITLNPNWTWLGYPVPFVVDINEALANLNASENDVVKSQSAFARYSEEVGWYGSLNQLTPGMGLMYQSHNSQPVTFNYGVGMSRALKANLTAEHNHWVPDIHAYPSNMSIMAVVELNGEELQDEGYELAVFNGSECRGSARLAYVPSLRRYVAFLTVTGEDDVDLYLALYDTMTGKAYYNTTDCPIFEANAVLGSLSMPFVARFGGTTDVDEWDAPNIELYPNPVVAGHLFQMEMPAECQGARVSIVNALGAVISTTDVYDEPVTLRAPAVPGVYTVRIVTDKQGTFTRKLIVNK